MFVHLGAKVAPHLVRALGNRNLRERTQWVLLRMGPVVHPDIVEGLSNIDPEVRDSCRRLLSKFPERELQDVQYRAMKMRYPKRR